MAVKIVRLDEIDTSAIDKLQAKSDGLLDGTLDRKTSRIGRLQGRIDQLHGDLDAVGSPVIKMAQEVELLEYKSIVSLNLADDFGLLLALI